MKNLKGNSEKNAAFSQMIISYFATFGIKDAFISPGSRNTPLTQALLANSDIKTYSIVDERSSAYVALGKTKSDKYKRPVLVITTSGTAVANLFPGIVEAFMSKMSMIIITADRPKKLVGTGSNQTIYQNEIFGRYTKFFDANPYIENIQEYFENSYKHKKMDELFLFIRKIYSISTKGLNHLIDGEECSPMPVHLNVPFDEPLSHKGFLPNIFKPNFSNKPRNPKSFLVNDDMGYSHSRILIICTDICDPVIIKASEKYHVPIFMECRSSRFDKKSKNIISNYDAILKNYTIKPDIILRFGSRPISKKLNELIDKNKQKTYSVSVQRRNNLNSSIIEIVQYLNKNKKTINKSWCDKIINNQKIIENQIQSFFKTPKCHEGYIINSIISAIPKNSNLMVGNSSPIRDLDSFTFNLDKKINIYSNRGASGIDGLISTAIGVSIGNKSFNALIIGDVSFYYDLTALNIANNIPVSLTIFIINNSGGHIFDRLDGLKTQSKSNYEKYWLTPVNLDIKSVAKVFNCHYQKITLNQYQKIDKIVNQLNTKDRKINLIEIMVDSEEHHSNNKEIEDRIKQLFI